MVAIAERRERIQRVLRGGLAEDRRRRIRERLITGWLFLAALVSVLTTAGIIYTLLIETIHFFQRVSLVDFLTDTQWTPLFAEKRFGIAPLAVATLLVSSIAMLVSLPLGLLAAIGLAGDDAPPPRPIEKKGQQNAAQELSPGCAW